MIFLNGRFSLTAKEFQVFENLCHKVDIQLLRNQAFSDLHFKIAISPPPTFRHYWKFIIICKRVQAHLVLSREKLLGK